MTTRTARPRTATQTAIEPGALRQLHDRLAVDADAAGVLDVAYRTVDTPVGVLLLAATDGGLVRVAFAREGIDDVLAALARQISPRILHTPRRLEDVTRQLDEYFTGRRRVFGLPLDHRLSAGFRLRVHQHLPHIRFGRTVTYKQVAEQVGSPNAVRAVGTACATNPLPVVVPCHRVVRSDGSVGGYLGGPEVKTALLSLERAA